MTIRKFKHLFQVRNCGYTVAQFTSLREAREFMYENPIIPSIEAYRDSAREVPNVGYRTRKISIYP